MTGLFGLLFIFLMLFRHAGACYRETAWDRDAKLRAIERGDLEYMTINGRSRLVSNNHKCTSHRTEFQGYEVVDLETGAKYYPNAIKAVKEMQNYKRFHSDEIKGTVYKYQPKVGYPIFVDYETEEPYFLAAYYVFCKRKEIVWFYTDFYTHTQFIRKSDIQLIYERQLREQGIEKEFFLVSSINPRTNHPTYSSRSDIGKDYDCFEPQYKETKPGSITEDLCKIN